MRSINVVPLSCASPTSRSILRKDVVSLESAHLGVSASRHHNVTYPGSQIRVCSAQVPEQEEDWAAKCSDIVASSDINNPKCTVDYTSVAVLKRNREARTDMDKMRIQLLAAMRAQWRRYQRSLDTDPIRTKALTSLVGLVVADCIAQAADPGAFDPVRTARMAAFGLCWHGVSGHYWYVALDRMVFPKQPKASGTIVAKMLADQLIWSPINTCIFFASLAAMEGNAASIPAILDEKLVSTVIAGYMLWPLAHLINFKFVPSRNRLLYINVVNLFWSIYLARSANATHIAANEPVRNLPMTSIPVSNSAATPPPPSFEA